MSDILRSARAFRQAGAFALFAGVSAFASAAFAQCGDPNDPGPHVALVLSGGGALASTQVGVIKVLEENGVPVHCVLGTSMGAVVGSLYAAGYSADELKDIFIDGADWNAISTGGISFRERSFRDKEYDKDFFSDYFLGIDEKGVRLPAAATSLRGMRIFLRRWLDYLPMDANFDDLPVPYRAVATDLSTGKAVILDHGDIVDSALASMAVPGLYPVQHVNGYALIDGGMSKQMPVDVARAMGADIIIAVDTTKDPAALDPNAPMDAVSAAMRLIDLQVFRNWEEQKALIGPGDLHLRPDTKGLSTTGFEKVSDGYDAGRKIAEANIDRLREIARTAAPVKRNAAPKDRPVQVLSVTVDSASGIKPEIIERRFDIKPGDVVTRTDMTAGLNNILALGVFNDVDYRTVDTPLEYNVNGVDVHLKTTPNPLGKQLLQMGAKMSTSFDNDSRYEVLAKITRRPFNEYGGRFSLALSMGTDNVLDIDFLQSVGGASRGFTEVGGAIAQRQRSLAIGDDRVAEINDQTYEIRAGVGREWGQWGLSSLGAFAVKLDSDVQLGTPVILGAQSGDYVGLTARLAADTLNSATFPTSGYSANLHASQYYALDDEGVSDDGLRGELSLAAARRLGRFGFYGQFDAGRIGNDAAGLPVFQLGGFKRMSGFLDNSIPATHYDLVRLETFTRLGGFDQGSLSTPIFIGGTLEFARFDLSVLDAEFGDDLAAGSLYGAVNTPLGPAYLAWGIGEGGRDAVYVYFGTAF